MVAVERDLSPHEREQRFLLHGVSWDHYCALVRMFERDGVHVLLTYCEGELELMSPGTLHEETKKIFSRLIEAYAEERDINLNGQGSTTFKRKAEERGAEPDECYSIGRPGKTPQMVLEIVYRRPKVDKLNVYRGLGVPEVWFYRRGELAIHVFDGKRYARRSKSAMLPDLDLAQLLSFVRPGADQTPLDAARKGVPTRASPRVSELGQNV